MRAIQWMLAAAALTIAATPSLAKAPATWDGLVHVDSKKVQAVYLLPNADFRGYTQVMFDPPQVAFRKDWRLDYNSSQDDPMAYVSSNYVTKAVALAQQNLAKVFPESFGRAGITIAPAPGPHVLRLAVYIVDLTVAAPDVAQDMSSTFSVDAGTATFAIEARELAEWTAARKGGGCTGGRRQWHLPADVQQQCLRFRGAVQNLGANQRKRLR